MKIRAHLTAIKIAFNRLGIPTLYASCLERRGSEMVENFRDNTDQFFHLLETKVRGVTLKDISPRS